MFPTKKIRMILSELVPQDGVLNEQHMQSCPASEVLINDGEDDPRRSISRNLPQNSLGPANHGQCHYTVITEIQEANNEYDLEIWVLIIVLVGVLALMIIMTYAYSHPTIIPRETNKYA
ncbi:hypothetical protein J6590_070856 [Homalodisca vitripennis]|nr:hypothetical protein J6590_070856 [Homalodisca vitripennis]